MMAAAQISPFTGWTILIISVLLFGIVYVLYQEDILSERRALCLYLALTVAGIVFVSVVAAWWALIPSGLAVAVFVWALATSRNSNST